jgi:hypothetical protein
VRFKQTSFHKFFFRAKEVEDIEFQVNFLLVGNSNKLQKWGLKGKNHLSPQ